MSQSTAMRVLIVDDEPLAREKLRGFLEKEDGIEVVAECSDGKEALLAVEEHSPDALFLDVQMPELDGFEVLANLEPEHVPPAVVFVTAFDQYALKAFDVHAVDYLLKPYDRERFQAALDRAREVIDQKRTGDVRQQLERLLGDIQEKRPQFPERMVIKSSGRVVLLKVDDIDWIDAAGNYVKIHAGSETHMLRETMSRLESRLDPERFLRIHRSTIVNLERIRELQQQFHGDYLVILKGGQRLTLSRSYRERVQSLLDEVSA